MRKIIGIFILSLAMLFSSIASAAVTNRDMQLMGGVVVSNATDSFFFCAMEEGLTRHWGLYALSTCANGPIKEIQDGYPARLVHADETNVYFLAYTDADRSIHSLFAVNIATGAEEELLSDIASAFVEEDDAFMYVTESQPYTLCRYSITDRASTVVKDMSNSQKSIYDAVTHKGTIYFITKAANGTEDGYQLHASSGKATNLDKPSPQLETSLLYEGFRIYANDKNATRIYSVKIGNKNATQMGQRVAVSLNSPRFADYMYTYDGDANRLVAYPLDGSPELTVALDGQGLLTRLIMGGTKDELLLYNNGGIYSLKPDLSSMTRLFDFDLSTGGQVWSYIAPARDNAIIMLGYNAETFTHSNNMMPTGVYAYDRSTGEQLFGYPVYDDDNPPPSGVPETLGDAPVEEREEGESYFVF